MWFEILKNGVDSNKKEYHIDGTSSGAKTCIHRLTRFWIDMQNGRTPLHSASWYGRMSTTRLLLEVGADVMATDNVSSCASIGRHLNDIWYRHYGKHSICFAKSNFINMWVSIYIRWWWWWWHDECTICNCQYISRQVHTLLQGYCFLSVTDCESRFS